VLVLARLALAAVLFTSASLKLARPRATSRALATFGLGQGAVSWIGWGLLVGGELALGVGVALGLDGAAYAAAALQLTFAGALGGALLAGRAGAPCGCFGSRSRVRALGLARNLLLAACFAALPAVPDEWPSEQTAIALGLVVALVAVAALALAVLALARQVGELKLALGSQPALDIAGEGPEIGSRSQVVERFSPGPDARFALAVFMSEVCPLCASVTPSLELLERDPLVALQRFDEFHDPEAWRAMSIPGAPYAVAMALDGSVLAKGTFNNFPQLESVLGGAERRALELADA
jgi:hypothetical protein